MIAQILAWLFPPKLPGKVRDWNERDRALVLTEQGWAGNTRRKYTGIEKHWMKHDKSLDKRYRTLVLSGNDSSSAISTVQQTAMERQTPEGGRFLCRR